MECNKGTVIFNEEIKLLVLEIYIKVYIDHEV